jgi:hypothetical protein
VKAQVEAILKMIEDGQISKAINSLNAPREDRTTLWAALLDKAQSELCESKRYRHGVSWKQECLDVAIRALKEALTLMPSGVAATSAPRAADYRREVGL